MKYELSSILLLCSTLCAAQSSITTPLDVDPPPSSAIPPKSPARMATAEPLQMNQQPEGGAEFARPAASSQRTIGPITAKSEFQRFAEDAAGRPLPVYGRALFDQVPTTFAPVEYVPVPAEYVIGPGDELIIRLWGNISLDARFAVDRNGQISIPKVGTLEIAGLHYSQLEDRVRSAVGVFYRDFEIDVTLGRLRSIQIYIFGNARQPGAYTVSSFSTLVNALFVSGGPSATGSMRSIQLRRGDQIITDFDIYDLLRKGDKSHDASLLPGDVIFIPPVGPQVAILGSVNEPGIYELKGNTSVDAALHAAGDLTALAGTKRVLVERIEDHDRRTIDEFPLDTAGLQRRLLNGDLLRVFPLSPQVENSVTLRGNVAQAGRYTWHEGMRISDLIPTREALITREFWNQQNHLYTPEGPNPFSVPAKNRFQDQVMYQSQMERDFRASDLGARSTNQPANPTQKTRLENQLENATPTGDGADVDTQSWGQGSISKTAQSDGRDTATIESIGRNSAEINWEYAVVERLDRQDLSTHLIPFRLASAIDDHSSADNQPLRSGDVITIFARSDLELPIEKHSLFVRIGGEVNAPGVYRVNPGDTLHDAVLRAGGLTSHSYLYASKFTRVSTRRAQEEQLRQSSEQMQKDLMSRYAGSAPAAGQNPAEQQTQLSLQQAAIAHLSAIKPTGRVVLQMKPTATTVEDVPTLPLEDGDAFFVPARLSTVQVAGSVYNPNAFRYQEDKSLSAYLNDAGGPTREADRRRVFVIRADGTVVSKQSKSSLYHRKFENLKLLPGDALVVPEKLKTPGGPKGILQFTQGISQAALTAAALSTVVP